MSGAKLQPARTALLVIDVQEAFRPYRCFESVATACGKLLAGARLMGLRRIVTEQYPKGLGPSAPELGLRHEPGVEDRPLTKRRFSAVAAEGFDLGGAEQVLICGIETHVCVAQSAIDLLERGVCVQLAADACGSRHVDDRQVALDRLSRLGAQLTTVEAALFELLGGAEAVEFKAVQGLIK